MSSTMAFFGGLLHTFSVTLSLTVEKNLLEFPVVTTPTRRMNKPPGDTGYQELILDLQLDHRVEGLVPRN